MNVLILNFRQIPRKAGSTNISFLIPISFDFAIDRGYHHKNSNIEFAEVVKKGIREVKLNDQRCLLTFFACISRLYDPFSDFLKLVSTRNTLTSVRKLAWLHYPIVW